MDMNKAKEIVDHSDLLLKLEALEVINGDCTKLLANWRAATPNRSDASPDAVLAIAALQDNMREQIRKILNTLGDERVPF